MCHIRRLTACIRKKSKTGHSSHSGTCSRTSHRIAPCQLLPPCQTTLRRRSPVRTQAHACGNRTMFSPAWVHPSRWTLQKHPRTLSGHAVHVPIRYARTCIAAYHCNSDADESKTSTRLPCVQCCSALAAQHPWRRVANMLSARSLVYFSRNTTNLVHIYHM